MTSYRRDYDERLPELEQAVRTMPGDISEYIPGLTRENLQRFFKRFSVQLGRLDKRGAKHGQYLAIEDGTIPELIIDGIDSAIKYLAAGAASFAQNSLPSYVRYQENLDKAVGTDPDEIKELTSAVAADLRNAVARSDDYIARLNKNVDDSAAARSKIEAERSAISSALEKATIDTDRISTVRRTVEAIVNPDARSKTSLETLARKARERVSEIEELSVAASKGKDDATESKRQTEVCLGDARSILIELRKITNQANEVLNLSSQAGLAASYSQESKQLGKRSLVFTITLYIAAAITALAAALYVLPQLSTALTRVGHGITVVEALSVTALRVGVLAPLVYVIFFSTRRIQSLELLRMDYAEKAAASLAYSGYREQMDTDEDLLRQLKSSLLIKFAEHPERLLRVGETTTSAKVKTAGFEAETIVGTKQADVDAE